MLERHWEGSVFPACARYGLGILCFSPLAEGVLTGKYLGALPTASRAASNQLGQFIRPRLTEENRTRVKKLAELGEGLGVPLAALALAWCLRRPEVSCVITGATRPEQIVENTRASGLHLDDDVLDRISAILGG
jgi:aryl-alcohol dehydrogenase-like predicted oxidoreductase